MNKRYKLYVEGRDDSAITCQLALKTDLLCEPNGKDPRAPKFHVREDDPDGNDLHGVRSLIGKMPDLIRDPGADRIGFVVDADDSLISRWESIRNVLVTNDYTSAPTAPDPEGVIVDQQDRPRVGVWIMPDNCSEGMIEDFLQSMIRPDDLLIPLAIRSVDEAISIDRRFPAQHRRKAVVHTWLAWQARAGRPQGVAIREGYVDPSCELAIRYSNWLVRLFG